MGTGVRPGAGGDVVEGAAEEGAAEEMDGAAASASADTSGGEPRPEFSRGSGE